MQKQLALLSHPVLQPVCSFTTPVPQPVKHPSVSSITSVSVSIRASVAGNCFLPRTVVRSSSQYSTSYHTGWQGCLLPLHMDQPTVWLVLASAVTWRMWDTTMYTMRTSAPADLDFRIYACFSYKVSSIRVSQGLNERTRACL